MTALATELQKLHPVTGAYSADPTEAAEQLNAENISATRPLTAAELRSWGAAGPRAKIQDAADSGPAPIRAIALTALDVLAAQSELDLATHGALLTALVTAGVIDQAEADQLTALAATTISRADQLGLGRVRTGTVERARS